MRFHSYHSLRLFNVVAGHRSLTAAAKALNLSKGAVSYQISRLEDELGFSLFNRAHRGIALTDKGAALLQSSQAAFSDIERSISQLREQDAAHLTIGLSTYFASRWLSPRLMGFMAAYPTVGLRLQPLVDLIDLPSHQIDLAIRWGKGDWRDLRSECLFACPAKATAGASIAAQVEQRGLQAVLGEEALLQDRDGSKAWQEWHQAAGFPYRPSPQDLVIPDPNVRVQAVIDGQGVALNDDLVAAEIKAGQLFQIADTQLEDYGYYLVYPKGAMQHKAVRQFRDWLHQEAQS